MKHNKKKCTYNCKDSSRDNKEKLKFQVLIQVLVKENYFWFSLVFGTSIAVRSGQLCRMSVCVSKVMLLLSVIPAVSVHTTFAPIVIGFHVGIQNI